MQQKADGLEQALENVIKSFTSFQDIAMRTTELPAHVAIALMRTGVEISSHSRLLSSYEGNAGIKNLTGNPESSITEDRSKIDGRSTIISRRPQEDACPSPLKRLKNFNITLPVEPSTPLFPWTNSHQHLTFIQRLTLCCIERGLQLLAYAETMNVMLHPALSLHLFVFPYISIPHLRTLAEAELVSSLVPDQYGPPRPEIPYEGLEMYRFIEGQGNFVERSPTKDTKSLAFGRTRTKVLTLLPGFEGEWLEPLDVKEDLETRGIWVGNEAINSVTQNIPMMNQPIYPPEVLDNPDLPTTSTFPPASNSRFTPLNQMQIATETTFEHMSTILNVQRLIETLALSAVCIGPGPGVRKDDIDKALKAAIAE